MPAPTVIPMNPEQPVVSSSEQRERFEQLVWPHLSSATNLARWLLRNASDAEDAVQDAMLRAYRFIDRFRGTDARPWLLQIVRNCCFTRIESSRPSGLAVEFDEESHHISAPTAEQLAIAGDERRQLSLALDLLSPRSREVLVLREMEGCSYREIAEITGTPIGTVMSTLARARQRLRQALRVVDAKEAR